jgi:hypothetical protein
MFGTIIKSTDQDDLKSILKILVFAIYRNNLLSDENIDYINHICYMIGFSDDEIENIFLIDTRYELDFEEIISNMHQNSIKILVIILHIYAKVFDDTNLIKYTKNKIYNLLPLDSTTIKDIVNYTYEYISVAVDIYNTIFDIKSNIIFGKKDTDKTPMFKKFFLIEQDKLDSATYQNKEYFIKCLIYFMYEDGNIDIKEKEALSLWTSVLNIDEDILINIDSFNDISIKVLSGIDEEWLKKFLIFSYVMSQDDTIKRFNRLRNYVQVNSIDEKLFNSLCKLTTNYNSHIKSLLNIINSTDLSKSKPNEDGSDKMIFGLNIAEAALSLIPGVALVNSIRQGGHSILSDRDSNIMNFGLVDIHKNISSDRIIICIDGFMSESNQNQFEDWKVGFEKLNIDYWIKGYKWPSNNLKTIIGGGLSSWYESVSNTNKAAEKLRSDIDTIYSFRPDIKISLMGFSLGARVIFNTLLKLSEMDLKVYDVHLFGGAVSKTNKTGWLTALSVVQNSINNYYSSNDMILKNLYRSTMAGDSPIGLGDIEYYKTKDIKIAKVQNYDVSDIINGHTEYKDKLDKIVRVL